MSEIEAIVLAGGRGSRMNHLTEEKQKCLLPVEDLALCLDIDRFNFFCMIRRRNKELQTVQQFS